MRTTVVTLLAVLATTMAARAEPPGVTAAAPASETPRELPKLDVHLGLGAPAGGFGLGVRYGRLELLGEGEVIALGMAFMVSASAHLHVDLVQRPRFGIYTGAFAAIFHVEAGVEDVVSETYRGAGGVVGLRAHSRPPRARFSQDLEAGAFYGRCAAMMCNDGQAFVSLQLAWRLHINLL